ncbi:gamma-glutamyl-gamma-aminobutyrate hydrolase family protein [Mesorhizobium sp. M0106]|uniref:gamma-glutamyl-gamma-aminobutyrate hydrolase family protein n=1 Tax=Mesorhizobium sp. M0106 TaxID=2956880 RepID=UPI003336F034
MFSTIVTAHQDQTVHDPQLERDSRLWQLCGEQRSSFRVNSCHHQAINGLAPEFVVSTPANDGFLKG